jgi:hypothetical protein
VGNEMLRIDIPHGLHIYFSISIKNYAWRYPERSQEKERERERERERRI